jgi:predicted anti-sigma-YlaC factor YlaD
VTCLEVRELLPELAVGVLPARDREEVEQHLRWCAGCRKEAGELGDAAATIAFALPPADLPDALRERVVGDVKHAAGAPRKPRRARAAAASTIAAAVALGSLGWGAVMANRADEFAQRAADANRQKTQAL